MEKVFFTEILSPRILCLTKMVKFLNNVAIGYMRITDLGIARVWNPDNAKDTSGTPGYMGKLKYSIIVYSS